LNKLKEFKNIENYDTFVKNIFLMMGFKTDLKTYERIFGLRSDGSSK